MINSEVGASPRDIIARIQCGLKARLRGETRSREDTIHDFRERSVAAGFQGR